jgi:hypothetical protein
VPLIEPGTADTTIEDLFTTARRQIGGTPNIDAARHRYSSMPPERPVSTIRRSPKW